MIPKINFKWVNIGLAVSAVLMIIILIICLATSGWIVHYKPFEDLSVGQFLSILPYSLYTPPSQPAHHSP